jgi:spermidine/putrescine transport system substrate-binding protein
MMARIIVLFLAWMMPTCVFSSELYIYNWSEYMPQSILDDFRKETGIKVHMATYDSNEAMYAKVKMLGGKGYDIVVPSTDYVARMIRDGLLRPLDKSQIPNLVNLDPKLLGQRFDPENTYSIPYMWGSTSIAINTKDPIAAQVSSLADLWNPALRGKILLPNDMRGVIGLALKRMGRSLNEVDPQVVSQACDTLPDLVRNVRLFDSDSPKQALLNGEVSVAVLWNGEAFIASRENRNIRYIYPAEGFSLWIDSLCILNGAKNIKEAHRFIDYILRPEVAARIAGEFTYSSPNLAARNLLDGEVRQSPVVYPPAEVMARGEFETDLGDAVKAYEACWMRIKTQ